MTKTQNTFTYDGLDRVIHERARLSILSALMAHQDQMAFNDLKRSCGLTDGNLSRHLQVLHEAGLIMMDKRFEGAKPLTTVALSKQGRERFLRYVEVLEQIVKDAAPASKPIKQKTVDKNKTKLA